MKILLLMLLFMTPVLAQEESEALRAMKLSCEKHKVSLGCYNYANMLVRADKSEESDKYFEMGCKLEHQPSCQKEKWDLPQKESKVAEEQTLPSPAPASVEEDEEVMQTDPLGPI